MLRNSIEIFLLKEKIVQMFKNEPLVKGVVGWIDITKSDVNETINNLKNESNGKLVGFRHVLDWEKDSNWIVFENVKRGLKVIYENNLTFDLLLRPHILKHAIELANEFPYMTFIIDHISKPRMNSEKFDLEWFYDLKEVSKFKNIYCKL